jgi:hypothetical protein
MDRRTFVAALAGVSVWGAGRDVRLEAFVAPELPATLMVPAPLVIGREGAIFELRAYRVAEWGRPFRLPPGFCPASRNSAANSHAAQKGGGRLKARPYTSRLREVFARAGMRPVLCEDLTWLIPFDSLTAREQAWNRVNADPEWTNLRRQFASYRFSLYRVRV